MSETTITLTDDEFGCVLEALGFAYGIYEKQRDTQTTVFIRALALRLEKEWEHA